MSSSLPPQQHQLRAHLPLRQRSSLTEQARKGGKLRQLQPNSTTSVNTDHEQKHINFLKSSGIAAATQEKILMLEKRVEFLRSQHTDTLTRLHGELDRLKTENRDLNFKLVMCRCGMKSMNQSREDRSRQLAQRRKATPKATKEKLIDDKPPTIIAAAAATMEGELQDLRGSLEKANKRNTRLMKVVEKMMQRSSMSETGSTGGPSRHSQQNVVLSPRGAAMAAAAPLLPEEYEDIICRLELINKKQADEIKLLKKDFHDLLISDEQPLPLFTEEPKQLRTNTKIASKAQESDEDLLYLSPSESRVVFPYIPLKRNHKVAASYDENYHNSSKVRLPPLTTKPSLVSTGTGSGQTKHKKIVGNLQRTKLGTFPR